MNRIFFLLIFLAFHSSLSAQKKKKEPRIITFIAMTLSPYSSGLSGHQDFLYEARFGDKKIWKNGIGNSYEVLFGVAAHPKVDYSVGLSFNSISLTQTNGFNYVSCQPEFYGAKEIVGAERLLSLKSLEIPVEVRYKFTNKKFQLYPSLGLNTIFVTGKDQSVDIFLDNGKVGDHSNNEREIESTRSINFGSIIKIGLSYKCNDRMKIKIEPFHKYNFGSEEYLDEITSTRLSRLGISGGFEYALKLRRR